MAPRANTRAVVQDASITFEHLSEELLELTAHTEMEAFLFAVKGKPEHPMPAFFTATNKGSRFLVHGLKRHQADISKEFKSYVLSSIEGKTIFVLNWQLFTALVFLTFFAG
ncbi:hypothetical protein K439DRAFT_1617581 [Ramaria rubella]|nr:hypothetical protein K439DRAFT_1617581 [Ramaria rubella]